MPPPRPAVLRDDVRVARAGRKKAQAIELDVEFSLKRRVKVQMRQQLRRLRLLFFSIRYTRRKQLFARLRLKIKRALLSRYASTKRKYATALPPEVTLSPAASPPQPLFAPRMQHLCGVSPLTLRFLNQTREIAVPIDWRPEDLRFGTRLWLLNLHYMEFLESLDDAQFVAVTDDWIANNRPYEPGYWLDNWNSYSLSIRVVVWMQQLAKRELNIDSSTLERIHCSLVGQIRFLSNNLELDIGGNHLIKNIKALLWASHFFAQHQEARIWQEIGTDLLSTALDEQILDDGMHYELSPAYHCQVLADLLECYSVLDEGNCRSLLAKKLKKMAQVVCDFTHADGAISLFNDAGLHMAYAPEECLTVAAEALNIHVQQATFVDYPNAGYFGTHGETDSLLVDAGNLAPDFLPAHGHGDALSFEWCVDGCRMIVDPGVYEYNAGARREYSRATRAHSTVSLDDLDQSEFWHAFRVGRRARIIDRKVVNEAGTLTIDASHDGYTRLAGAPIHRRVFTLRDRQLNIQDFITGGKGQKAVARLMLHPDCQIENTLPGKVLIRRGGAQLQVETKHTVTIENACCFLDFGEEYEAKQLLIDFGSAPCTGEFMLSASTARTRA